MGDFVIRNVRIEDNGDNIFNPAQDPVFNLEGIPVREDSMDARTFLGELGVHSFREIQGRNLFDLQRYQRFQAMGGRYLERNQFKEAALNFLSAAEMANQMQLPAADFFRQIVGIFEQRRIQATYHQIQMIRQSPQHGFASLFLVLDLIQQMPDSIPGESRHVWGPEIKRELFVFFHRELMSMLRGSLAVLENSPHGLPQVDHLWEASRRLEQISQENFSEPEAQTFGRQIEYARRRLALLGARAVQSQVGEMLRDPWTHADTLLWIRQRLEIYQAFRSSHPNDAENAWWVLNSIWSGMEALKGQIDSKLLSLAQGTPSLPRATNMDEAGSSHTGTVWYLRQVHADPTVPITVPSLSFPMTDNVRATAAYQVQIFRELRNIHLRIGSFNTLHVFKEGDPYTPYRDVALALDWVVNPRIARAFPQGMPLGPLNDEQSRLIYALGASYIYQRLYPHVESHGIDAVPPNYRDLASMPGISTDFRDSNAVYPIALLLRANPGQEVALQLGGGHRVWDDFERFYRGGIYPTPRIRSVCWDSSSLRALDIQMDCPAFSE